MLKPLIRPPKALREGHGLRDAPWVHVDLITRSSSRTAPLRSRDAMAPPNTAGFDCSPKKALTRKAVQPTMLASLKYLPAASLLRNAQRRTTRLTIAGIYIELHRLAVAINRWRKNPRHQRTQVRPPCRTTTPFRGWTQGEIVPPTGYTLQGSPTYAECGPILSVACGLARTADSGESSTSESMSVTFVASDFVDK